MPTWASAARNTTRCLIGCSLGDFGALFLMQYHEVSLPMGATMAIAMASGLLTSFAVETGWLMARHDMDVRRAAKTAFGMSAISMLSMELAENVVDLSLTGGQLDPSAGWWWGALGASLTAGFLTPLPYNYYMLRKHGKSCH